jgi:hypothetical protein
MVVSEANTSYELDYQSKCIVRAMTMTIQPDTKVWRYMSFAKFFWLLQNKQLWFPSLDILDDKWEGVLTSEQISQLLFKISSRYRICK